MRRDARPLRRAIAAAGLAMAAAAAPACAGLCGDASGDGFLAASDALLTLRLAVDSGYDRRGDVAPAGGNGTLTASDALEVLRASVEGRVPRCHGATATRALVTTAPYDFAGGGGVAVVDLASRTLRYRAGAIGGDAVMRAPAGRAVVVNRQGRNSLQVVDADKTALPTVKECSVSDGFDSNPQDVVLVGPGKGYVTLYAGAQLLVIDPSVLDDPKVDPACSGIVKKRIDLGSFDDDGIPQMDQMVVVGDELFVALQLLDEALQPKTEGRLVVIDTVTDAVKAAIPLSFRNPFAQTKGIVHDEFQELLFLGGPGSTGATRDDGGIEAVNPVTRSSVGLVLAEADIGANIFDFVIVGTRRAFAIVADSTSNSVVDVDLGTRSVRKVLLSSTALISDIEMTEHGELWVAYRGETAGDPPALRVFRVLDGAEDVSAKVALPQAPFTLLFAE